MKLRLIFLFAILLSCSEKPKTETGTVDFGNFTINIPGTWQPVRTKGIDSYVGQLTLDHGDTVTFDLGWYSNSLEEDYNFIVENGDLFLKHEITPDSAIWDFYGKIDTVDVEKFKVNKVSWKMIDSRKAKIVQPRHTGKGMTGIYFDSLWTAGSGIDRFQMSGNDLHPDNERCLLEAFKTLKFKK